MADWVIIYPIDKINLLWLFYSLLQPLCSSSFDPTIKDGALGLLADLGQPDDVLALTGSLPGESFDGFFASLPEN